MIIKMRIKMMIIKMIINLLIIMIIIKVTVMIMKMKKKEESSKVNSYPASDKIQHFEKNITNIRSYYQSQSHITYLTINSNRDPDEVVKDIIDQVNKIEKKKADYSQLDIEQEEKEDDEEKSNKYFTRIYGTKRAELVQLML